MCHAVRCRTCELVTWRGCGRHVDHVMARVPKEARCPGHEGEPRGGILRWWPGR